MLAQICTRGSHGSFFLLLLLIIFLLSTKTKQKTHLNAWLFLSFIELSVISFVKTPLYILGEDSKLQLLFILCSKTSVYLVNS